MRGGVDLHDAQAVRVVRRGREVELRCGDAFFDTESSGQDSGGVGAVDVTAILRRAEKEKEEEMEEQKRVEKEKEEEMEE